MDDIEVKKNFKPIASLIGGSILMLYFGSIYITGNISPYIQAYLQSKGDGCTDQQIYLLIPGITITQTIIMPFAGFIQQKFNYRVLLTLSITFGLTLFVLSSFMTSFWPFFICYSGGFGVMLGLVYTIPLYNTWKHFPQRKSLVTGLVLCGFGFGGMVFGLIATNVANPHGLPDSDEQVYRRVPLMLRVMACVYLFVGVIGIALTFPANKQCEYQQFEKNIKSQEQEHTKNQEILSGDIQTLQFESSTIASRRNSQIVSQDKSDFKHISQSKIERQVISYNPSEVIERDIIDQLKQKPEEFIDGQQLQSITRGFKIQQGGLKIGKSLFSRQFITLYIMFVFSIFIGFYMLSTYKKFAEQLLKDDKFISLMGSIAPIFGGIRFQWGPLVDYFSFTKVYAVILIVQIILGFSFPFFAAYHSGTFGISLCLFFTCEAAHFTLMPIMITRLFKDSAEIIYPFAFSFIGMSQLLTTLIETWIVHGDYATSYYMGSGFCLVSLAILILGFKDQPFNQ